MNEILLKALKEIANKNNISGNTCFYEDDGPFTCDTCDVPKNCAYYIANKAIKDFKENTIL